MDAAPLPIATADPALPPLPPLTPELRRVDLRAPTAAEALVGLGGLLALGAAFSLGAPRPSFQLGGFLVSLLGAFVFTGPTLVVLHPAWGHTAPTDALLRTLSWSLVRTGRLALALSPLALLFVAAGTTLRVVFMTTWLGVAALGSWSTFRALVAVECRAVGRDTWSATPLFLGWTALTAVVALVLLGSWYKVAP